MIVVGVAVPTGANPVNDGKQPCAMLTSEISQDKTQSYIVLGTAIGRQQQASQQITAMKADVFKVARATCPEQFRLR
jgi:hypothetical protein